MYIVLVYDVARMKMEEKDGVIYLKYVKNI